MRVFMCDCETCTDSLTIVIEPVGRSKQIHFYMDETIAVDASKARLIAAELIRLADELEAGK